MKLAPVVIAGVKAIETEVTGAGKGATKKQLVMHALASLEAKPEVLAAASAYIDKTVTTLNKSGDFSHGVVPAATSVLNVLEAAPAV
jgi:hypothetical protein